MRSSRTAGQAPIHFGEKLASSNAFKTLFRDGMGLVEATAAYLDGSGRDSARRLPRSLALVYASESMRLTTRLMQIASWLLLQRAINEGEMTETEASADKGRTRQAWAQPQSEGPDERLPLELLELINKSKLIQERIVRMDNAMGEAPRAPVTVPTHSVRSQLSALQDAFPPA